MRFRVEYEGCFAADSVMMRIINSTQTGTLLTCEEVSSVALDWFCTKASKASLALPGRCNGCFAIMLLKALEKVTKYCLLFRDGANLHHICQHLAGRFDYKEAALHNMTSQNDIRVLHRNRHVCRVDGQQFMVPKRRAQNLPTQLWPMMLLALSHTQHGSGLTTALTAVITPAIMP